jgi:2,3,4,5-tetrahydropyridine-2-carboxylate N-succinyltransferase
MDTASLRERIETLAREPQLVRTDEGAAIDEVMRLLDRGELRAAEPWEGGWRTNAWVKQAILLFFARLDTMAIGPHVPPGAELTPAGRGASPSFYDKVPFKRNFAEAGVRCVPPGVARYASFLGRGVILMPGYVNIGAYVDEGSMIDTWATVGSCAQIGKGVHLSGGVGIGGVLEPANAQPVIVEDGAFIGSRCVIVEGVRVGREAVLGAGVVLTASTPIVDVRGSEPVAGKGVVPPRAVVIPGTMPKAFPAGSFEVPCALIIGERSESTDRKTTLEAALRDFAL